MLGSVKSMLGFGGSSAAPAETTTAADSSIPTSGHGGGSTIGEGTGAMGGMGGREAGVGEPSMMSGGAGTGMSSERTGGMVGMSGSEGGMGSAGGLTGSRGTYDGPSDTPATSSTNDPMKESSANAAMPRDNDVTTGAAPTESADPTTENRAVNDSEQSSEAIPEGGLAEHENKLSDAAKGSARQNEDAIPTAGGEKLGAKHWGESKVVPDNPKPAETGAGVSSKDGQPTGTYGWCYQTVRTHC